MPEGMKPAYLLSGTDAAKIDAARGRLRARAEAEGGPAALHVFEPQEGRGAPDHEAVLAAVPALSLTESRRYLLVDGVERWRDPQHRLIAAAIADLPPDLTLVLIARGKVPAALSRAVEEAGGELLAYETPRGRALPAHLTAEAKRLGFRLEPEAARMLAARMGGSSLRLGQELERLALWAGPGGEVTAADLEAMIADTSEAAVWSLSDALLDRDPEAAVRLADRLLAQGENVTGLVYALASRLRRASEALAGLEAGTPRKEVERGLGMHPYAARQLLSRLGQVSTDDLREATAALADLEVWCRGGADYGDELAFTLALRRAAGAEAAAA
jgi:DNA polymerase-3 subunit delta